MTYIEHTLSDVMLANAIWGRSQYMCMTIQKMKKFIQVFEKLSQASWTPELYFIQTHHADSNF